MGLLNNILVAQRPRSRIRGIGTFLPERVVDNAELCTLITCADDQLRETLPRYIEALTGIQSRRWTDPAVAPSMLAAQAARVAFERAELTPGDIDTLIFAATDLDHIEPATATVVQEHLGLGCVNSFDVKCACNSVLQAMFLLDAMIAAGACRKGLIVCGEAGSQWANLEIDSREELQTKLGGLTLGDGGAAIIMEAADDERGLLEFNLTTLPNSWRYCHAPHDIEWRSRSERSIMGWFYLDLNALARMVREQVPAYCDEYTAYRLEEFGEASFIDNVHYLVPHQISERLIRLLSATTRMPYERIAITADRYGNTAAASIPIAMDEAIRCKSIVPGSGQEVLLFGAASGFSIGHVRIRI